MLNYAYTYIKGTHTQKEKGKKKSDKDLSNDAYAMFLWVFLIFFIQAYFVDTHLNCVDLSMQFK